MWPDTHPLADLHRDHEETFYVLKGELTVRMEENVGSLPRRARSS